MDDLKFTAIHIGEYNEGKVRDVLSYIEENYPDVRWVGCEKPTDFIDYDNEIFYDGLGYDDESEYEIIEAEDFMSAETLEDIQTDISFLFN